jgi:modulator of FtsH protease
MNQYDSLQSHSTGAALSTSKMVRNTYLLLSVTLLFSALAATWSVWFELGRTAAMLLSFASFGILFWVQKTADSAQGLIAIFAFTGCLGAALGPMLSFYLKLPSGPTLVMEALALTALVFLALSAYAMTSKRDFSFMGGFLVTGMLVVFVAMLANIFLQIAVLSMVLPAAIVLIMSGLILFETSRIVHGGETNYIRATLSLYLSFYNLFTAILQLLGGFQRR